MKRRKILSLALALVMVLALMPTAAAMTGVKITKKGQVVDSITFKGVTVNAIYAPQSTVSNYSSDPTYCCAAFVSKFFREVYGVKVYNLVKNGGGPKVDKGSFSVTTDPQVGDVVHRKTDTSTHWAIIKAVDSKTVTLIEQNAWYSRKDDKARVGKTYDRSDSAVTFYRYHPVEEKESRSCGEGNHTKGDYLFKEAVHPHYVYWTCSVCGEKFTDNSTLPLDSCAICNSSCGDGNHTKGDYLFREAVHPHYVYWTCSVCGEKFTDNSTLPLDSCAICNSPVPDCSNGHTWSDWKTVKEAACGVEGQRTRTCSVCGETETETLPALEHNYRVDGETDGAIYYVCTNCGDNYTEEKELPVEDKGDISNFTAKNRYNSGLFSDVNSKHWFSENVKTTYELGLMKGTGSGTFSPGNNVTPAEAVTLAARIHSTYYTGSDYFASYDGGNWYDPYVDYARENNIINTYYNYSRPATREEFVHILAKALPKEALENIAGRVSFADSGDITYMADVRLLSGAGVINGIKEDGEIYFKPLNTITRAEVAAVVGRMAKPNQRVGY